jgi:hypothetical protein
MITIVLFLLSERRVLGWLFSYTALCDVSEVEGLFFGEHKQMSESPHKNKRIKNHSKENIQSSLSLP